MRLGFPAELAELLKREFPFAFCVHIDLVPLCYVILVLTNGTNQSHQFSCTFLCHMIYEL